MPNAYTSAELATMKVAGELRPLLRAEYPECIGPFAAQATRDECVAILTGDRPAGEVMKEWFARMSGQATTGNILTPPGTPVPGSHAEFKTILEKVLNSTPDLPAGAHGENPPPPNEAPLQRALRILEVAAPDAVPMVLAWRTQLEEAKKELADRPKPSLEKCVVIGQPGETVTIGKSEVPVVLASDDPECVHVPAIDKDYRFDIWRAETPFAGGSMKFTQDVDDFIRFLLAGKVVLLAGARSVGKTSVVQQFAARCRWPSTRFPSNRDVTVQDFVGCSEARNGQTIWVDGPLPHAMAHGHILIIDEADHMPAECSSILHAVLEGADLLIAADHGRVVKRHPNFRIVLTANTAGFGDETGIHANAKVQDAAFVSRLARVLRVTWPLEKHEKQLLVRKTGIKAAIASLIIKTANATRKAAEKGDLQYAIDLRQTVEWADETVRSNLATGFACCVLNKLPTTDLNAVAEIAQRSLGDALTTGSVPTAEGDPDDPDSQPSA